MHGPIFALGLFSHKTCAFQDAQGHDILPFFLSPLNTDPPHRPILFNGVSHHVEILRMSENLQLL